MNRLAKKPCFTICVTTIIQLEKTWTNGVLVTLLVKQQQQQLQHQYRCSEKGCTVRPCDMHANIKTRSRCDNPAPKVQCAVVGNDCTLTFVVFGALKSSEILFPVPQVKMTAILQMDAICERSREMTAPPAVEGPIPSMCVSNRNRHSQ